MFVNVITRFAFIISTGHHYMTLGALEGREKEVSRPNPTSLSISVLERKSKKIGG